MTNKEIIAEKIMGWEYFDEPMQYGGCSKQGWFKDGKRIRGKFEFAPEEHDADCMMAWDKFCEKYSQDGWQIFIKGHMNGWIAWITCRDGSEHYVTGHSGRRRAMCECMAKAVTT